MSMAANLPSPKESLRWRQLALRAQKLVDIRVSRHFRLENRLLGGGGPTDSEGGECSNTRFLQRSKLIFKWLDRYYNRGMIIKRNTISCGTGNTTKEYTTTV